MKKPFLRAGADHTQSIRRWFQLAFFALNAWIGVQFYLFVRYYETGGGFGVTTRPPGVEGWLPIASLMNLKVWFYTGELPGVHPAGVVLLVAFLLISWLVRKSFCSWLCPVGTVSQYLAKAGHKLFRKRITLPRWADVALRSLKYILMALFLYAVAMMTVEEIGVFLGGPHGIVADVKMLNFFRELTMVGAIVMAALVVLSMFIVNFWCRYLCPYGALMGLLGKLSPMRIQRVPSLCIDCGKCARACPSSLAVDKLITIGSAECTSCMSCVASCPVENALYMSVAARRRLPVWAMAGAIALIFFGFVGYAKITGHWETMLPQTTYMNLVPKANEFAHP
jgi:polyferredoxin